MPEDLIHGRTALFSIDGASLVSSVAEVTCPSKKDSIPPVRLRRCSPSFRLDGGGAGSDVIQVWPSGPRAVWQRRAKARAVQTPQLLRSCRALGQGVPLDDTAFAHLQETSPFPRVETARWTQNLTEAWIVCLFLCSCRGLAIILSLTCPLSFPLFMTLPSS